MNLGNKINKMNSVKIVKILPSASELTPQLNSFNSLLRLRFFIILNVKHLVLVFDIREYLRLFSQRMMKKEDGTLALTL